MTRDDARHIAREAGMYQIAGGTGWEASDDELAAFAAALLERVAVRCEERIEAARRVAGSYAMGAGDEAVRIAKWVRNEMEGLR